MDRRGAARIVLSVGAAACLLRASVAATPPPADPASVLNAVGQRVVNFYRHAQNVICLNTSTVQPIDRNWSMQGFARTVESELHVELDAADGDALPAARLVRDIRRVNGRPPREGDKKSRAGCTDPNPLSPEPLAFLLPPERDEYRFTAVRDGRERDRAAFVLDFATVENRSRLELFDDPHGRDDCVGWTGTLATRGELWIDAETYDVLRIDRRLLGPVDIRVPPRLQRRHNFAETFITLDRDDVSMRFKAVTFTDPDEVLLLPDTTESIMIVRSTLQSTRRTETFSGYRRFLTEGRIKGR
jgi:hypothetical protein